MGIFSRCADILRSNKKDKVDVDATQRLLGKIKSERLAYDTQLSRIHNQVNALQDDIDKYTRYLERGTASQNRIYQAKLDDAKAKLDGLEPHLAALESQCKVLSATCAKLEAECSGTLSVTTNIAELQQMIDIADSLQQLDSTVDPELEALMKKYQ